MRSLACTLVLALLSGSWPGSAYASFTAVYRGPSGYSGGAYPVQLASEVQGLAGSIGEVGVSAALDWPALLSPSLSPDASPQRRDAALLLASALVHPETFLPGVSEALTRVAPEADPALGARAASGLLELARTRALDEAGRRDLAKAVGERGYQVWDSPEPLLAKVLESGRVARDEALAAAGRIPSLPGEAAFDGGALRGNSPAVAAVEAGKAELGATSPGLLPAGAASAAAPAKDLPGPAQPGKESLPALEYHPYLFFWANHLLFFYLYVPFFSLEVLKAGDSWVPWYVTSYALGSFARSIVQIFRPHWLGVLSKKGWSVAGLAATMLFLGATLAGVPAAVSVFLAFPLGIGISAGLVQWKSYYQKELAKERQPALFRRLSDLGVWGTLLPFAGLSAAGIFLPGLSIPFLLTLVAGAMGLVALATLLTLRSVASSPAAAPASNKRAASRSSEPLPRAYWWYLTGLFLSSVGQAVMTSLAPILAYGAKGALFTFGSQALGLGAILLGSWAGKRWVEARGAKSAYLVANVLNGLGFLPLILTLWNPAFAIPALLFFSFVGGFTFGALRGVAEQQITVDVLGQANEGLLNKANSMYYALVSPAYIGTSFLAAWLLPIIGTTPFIVAGGLAMFASLLPFWMVRVRPPDGVGLVDSRAQEAEAKALLMEYWRDFVKPYSDESDSILAELQGRKPWPFAQRGGRMFRVIDDGRVAGVVGLVDVGPGQGEIKRFYVSPLYQGKGYGKALMATAIAFARDNGMRTIRLETHRQKMPAAVKLYRSMGFVETGLSEKETDPNWTWMELRLGRSFAEVKTAADLETIRPLLQRYADERLPGGGFLLPDSDRELILQELKQFPHWPYGPPAGRFLRLDLDGRPVGTAALMLQGPDTVELRRFYVSPEARKGGNGAALLGEVLRQAREMGASTLRLGTHRVRMSDAVRLYESAGFRETGPYSDEFPDWIWMERSLK